jgi:small subunit ribosomal protein S16
LVRLRLWRGGKKKQPIYRIVAAHSQTARNGKYIELVGQYNPGVSPVVITLTEDRILYWLGVGAQPTDTVRSLLQRKGLWLKWGLMKKGADEAKIAEQFAIWESLQEEKTRRETDKKLRRKAARKKKAAADGAPAVAQPAPTAEAVAEPEVVAAPVAAAAPAPAADAEKAPTTGSPVAPDAGAASEEKPAS